MLFMLVHLIWFAGKPEPQIYPMPWLQTLAKCEASRKDDDWMKGAIGPRPDGSSVVRITSQCVLIEKDDYEVLKESIP